MVNPTYSRQTLEESPLRVLQFLAGVGTSPLIRAALAKVGYSDREHQEGWSLLHGATGFHAVAAESPGDRSVDEAIVELDAWDEPNFRIARAALSRRHPEQAEFVFAGLQAAAGPAAVLSVHTFLDRIDALAGILAGRDHTAKAQKQADAAAVKTLASRGITEDERARLRQLLTLAEGGQPAAPRPQRDDGAARRESLAALRAWFDEWSETARVVIKRRDHLIRLGLAKRRVGGGAEDVDPADKAPRPAAT